MYSSYSKVPVQISLQIPLRRLGRTVEFWVLPMEGQLGHEVVYVLGDERRISSHALACSRSSRQALEPAGVRLRLLEGDWVALLEHFVYCDERLEHLDFVGQDWLATILSAPPPRWSAGLPTLSCPTRSSGSSCGPTYTQCMLARAFLHHRQPRSRGSDFADVTFG